MIIKRIYWDTVSKTGRRERHEEHSVKSRGYVCAHSNFQPERIKNQMLKIRLMGTVKDIDWFRKLMENHEKIRVMEVSRPYANKGTDRYYRVYCEVEKEENTGGK